MSNEGETGKATTTPAPARARLPWWAKLCVALVIVAGVMGFVHVVYGPTGFDICAKDGWALEDTFVDTADYVGQPLIALVPKAKVVRALISCEVLTRPRRPTMTPEELKSRVSMRLNAANLHGVDVTLVGTEVVLRAGELDCTRARSNVESLDRDGMSISCVSNARGWESVTFWTLR